MGHSIHQVLINSTPQAVIAVLYSRTARCPGMVIHRYSAAYSPLNQILRLVDTVRHRNHDNRLAVKPRHFHVLIRCNDNGIRPGDLFPGEYVLGAAGTVRLSL